jgi:hypothetical protein
MTDITRVIPAADILATRKWAIDLVARDTCISSRHDAATIIATASVLERWALTGAAGDVRGGAALPLDNVEYLPQQAESLSAGHAPIGEFDNTDFVEHREGQALLGELVAHDGSSVGCDAGATLPAQDESPSQGHATA